MQLAKKHQILFGLDPIRFFLGISAFAWAYGIYRYIDMTIWTSKTIGGTSYSFGATPFPFWPNILDVIGMIIIGLFLLWESTLKRKLQ